VSAVVELPFRHQPNASPPSHFHTHTQPDSTPSCLGFLVGASAGCSHGALRSPGGRRRPQRGGANNSGIDFPVHRGGVHVCSPLPAQHVPGIHKLHRGWSLLRADKLKGVPQVSLSRRPSEGAVSCLREVGCSHLSVYAFPYLPYNIL
jgi:hypothetical protein